MKWLALALLIALIVWAAPILPHEFASSETVGVATVEPCLDGASPMLWLSSLLNVLLLGAVVALTIYVVQLWEEKFRIGQQAIAQMQMAEQALRQNESSWRETTVLVERAMRRLEQLSRSSNGAA